MGSIIIILSVIFLAIIGIENLLIGLAIGCFMGIVGGIIKAVQEKKNSNSGKQNKLKTNKQASSDDVQIINDMIILHMVDESRKKITKKRKIDMNTYWETHCESCGELLEDCECDNKVLSKQDISQDIDDLEFDEIMDILDEEK